MEPMLPSPQPEHLGDTPEVPVIPAQAAETAPSTRVEASRETVAVQPSTTVQDQGQDANDVQAVAVQSTVASSTPQDDSSSPQIADDVDVIEKEWVDKAKKIVSTTKDDPYEQEKQVSHLQADYLSKRYNKQIKIPE